MNTNKANGQYEVLSPWAEVDPIPLRGISPRLTDMTGKKIGLYMNSKIAARPMLNLVAEKLKAKSPTLTFTSFVRMPNVSIAETEDYAKFKEWVKELDAAIFSHGD